MMRFSATSEKSGVSMKPSSHNRMIGKRASKEISTPKLTEWKHTCPCDEKKCPDFVTVSVQCLCEEVNLEKELILFFYNTIMEKTITDDYLLDPEQCSVSYESLLSSEYRTQETKHKHKLRKDHAVSGKDIRNLTNEDKKNTLVGAGGSQINVKRKLRSGSKNLVKESLSSSPSTTHPRVRKSMCKYYICLTGYTVSGQFILNSIFTPQFEYSMFASQ